MAAAVAPLRLPHVVVVGGGVAGLTLAHALKVTHAAPAHVTLLDAAAHPGGWLSSTRVDGFLFENGCRGIRPVGRGRAALELVERLGLQAQTVASSDSARTRYLLHGGRLERLPSSLRGVWSSPLTRSLPLRAMREAAMTGGAAAARPDESVHAFVLRHFGSLAADVLVDAALSGIYAGDPKQLSAKSVLRSLWDLETSGRGSIVRGALADAIAGNSPPDAAPPPSPFVAACQRASSVSFIDGMGTLPRALATALEAAPDCDVLTGAGVVSVEARDSGGRDARLRVTAALSGGQHRVLHADHVVFALPASRLADVVCGAVQRRRGERAGGGSGSTSGGDSDHAAGLVAALRTIPVSSYKRTCVPWGCFWPPT